MTNDSMQLSELIETAGAEGKSAGDAPPSRWAIAMSFKTELRLDFRWPNHFGASSAGRRTGARSRRPTQASRMGTQRPAAVVERQWRDSCIMMPQSSV